MNRNYVIVTLFLLWLLRFTLQTYRRWRIQSYLCRTVEMPAHILSLGGKAELQMLETPQMISIWKHMNISEKCCHSHTCTHIRLTALFRGYLGEPVPEGNTNLDFTEARDSEWQWHQLGHMQVCTSLPADNHASTPSLSFYWLNDLPATQPTVSKHWRHHQQGQNPPVLNRACQLMQVVVYNGHPSVVLLLLLVVVVAVLCACLCG